MALNSYMTIKGTVQGDISKDASSVESVGNACQADHEDSVLVLKIEHEIDVPTDPLNGQPSGKAVHGPYKVWFATNQAKPLLLEAICTAESLVNVTVNHYRATGDNDNEHYYTTELSNARIIKLRTVQPHTQEEHHRNRHQEVEIWFSYGGIKETHLIGKTNGSYTWGKETQV